MRRLEINTHPSSYVPKTLADVPHSTPYVPGSEEYNGLTLADMRETQSIDAGCLLDRITQAKKYQETKSLESMKRMKKFTDSLKNNKK